MTGIEGTAEEAADRAVRVPANIMGLLRQSYDSREKVLDWLLAGAVVSAMAFMFRDQLRAMLTVDGTANAGRTDPPVPNQDVSGAFPTSEVSPQIYTYNMPISRRVRYSVGPSSTSVPGNPASPPVF